MAAREIPWRRWIPWIVVPAIILVILAFLLPAIQQAREAARRAADSNNLRTLGLALNNYHDAYKSFPPGSIISDDGVALQGWMIEILPFVEATPLYNFTDFEYAWNDPVNAHVFRYPIDFYLIPGRELIYTTDGFGVSHYTANSRVMFRNSSVTRDELEIASSQTWLVRDNFEDWPPWGAPFNWNELNWPVPGIDGPNGWLGGAGLHVLMADESVRFVGRGEIELLSAIDQKSETDDTRLQTRKPEFHYEYSKHGLGGDWTPLDEDEEHGLAAVACNDADGGINTVHIQGRTKFVQRATTPDDLRKIVGAYPDAKILLLDRFLTDESLALADETVTLLSQMPRLEVLRIGHIEVTDAGIEALRKMTTLKILAGLATEDMQARLREALPDCKLRLKTP